MVFMDFVVFGIYQVFILYTKKPLPLQWMEPVDTIVCNGVKLKYAPKLVPI